VADVHALEDGAARAIARLSPLTRRSGHHDRADGGAG